jgi:hypothetical protein
MTNTLSPFSSPLSSYSSANELVVELANVKRRLLWLEGRYSRLLEEKQQLLTH